MSDDTKNPQADRPVWSPDASSDYVNEFVQGPPADDGMMGMKPYVDESNKPELPDDASLEEKVIATLKTLFDPEIPVNIYELGLIYGVEADADNNVHVTMTLTTPHCPVAETMPGEVELRVGSVEGVNNVEVNVVWDPPWEISKMSDEARLELGLL